MFSCDVKTDAQRTYFPNVFILWGDEAWKQFLCQHTVYVLWDHGGERMVVWRPSCSSPQLSCRGEITLIMPEWKHMLEFLVLVVKAPIAPVPPIKSALRRDDQDHCQAISVANLTISPLTPPRMHADAFSPKLMFVQETDEILRTLKQYWFGFRVPVSHKRVDALSACCADVCRICGGWPLLEELSLSL